MKERSCPHGGKYCFNYGSCENCEWGKILQKNKRYRAKIRELKEDLRIEKHNHGVTKEFYNKSVNEWYEFVKYFSLYYPHGQIPYSVFEEQLKEFAKSKGVEVE